MRERRFVDALLFIFSPVHNPFFAVMWRQQRRNMGQFMFHLGLMLGFIWLVFVGVAYFMEALNVAPHWRGLALYEVVAWSHLFAAFIYNAILYRRYRQFWREDTLPQLLLTGVPPLWIVLAISVYPFFIQAYIAVLCLPFYAAAVAMSGISWSTVVLTIATIMLLAQLTPSWAWIFWVVWLASKGMVRMGILALWSNLPFMLATPIRFYAWTIPSWLFLALFIPLAFAFAVTQKAWSLEPRRYPTQVRVGVWSSYFFLALAVLFGGLIWAYGFPADFESKTAFTLLALRLLSSLSFWSYAFTEREAVFVLPKRAFAVVILVLNLAALALTVFFGLSSHVPHSTLLRVLVIGFVLGISHSLAYGLGYKWWQKMMQAQRVPASWWLVFFIWLISPAALFVQPLAPLAGIQGWLVPLCLLPSSFAQQGSAYLPFGIKIFIPTWLAAVLVQVAWSGLLWLLERKSVMPQVEPRETNREWLTVAHPVWGWLARLEERICERLANPLINLQLRQQSRFTSLKVAMDIGIVTTIFVLSLWLAAKIYPQTDFANIVNEIFVRLPSLVGLAAFFAAGLTRSAYENKFALWLLGQKRVVESFVLAPLTKTQWRLGWWFPRFWLCLKAMLPYTVCLWTGTLLQPDAGKILVALLVTLNLPIAAFVYGLMSLAESLMNWRESILWLLLMTSFEGVVLVPFCLSALPSSRWQPHALGWLFIFAINAVIAIINFAIFSRRIDLLRSPGGYEQWLQLAEVKFRQAQRWRSSFL